MMRLSESDWAAIVEYAAAWPQSAFNQGILRIANSVGWHGGQLPASISPISYSQRYRNGNGTGRILTLDNYVQC